MLAIMPLTSMEEKMRGILRAIVFGMPGCPEFCQLAPGLLCLQHHQQRNRRRDQHKQSHRITIEDFTLHKKEIGRDNYLTRALESKMKKSSFSHPVRI